MSLNLPASVRAIVLNEDNQVLLCRFVFPPPGGPERSTDRLGRSGRRRGTR